MIIMVNKEEKIMLLKKIYETPSVEVCKFDRQDVITVSNPQEGNIDKNNGTFDEIFGGNS